MVFIGRSPKWAYSLLLLAIHCSVLAQSPVAAPLEERVSPAFLRSVPPNGGCAGATVVPVPPGVPVTVTGNNANAPTDPVFMANLVWEGFTITACSDFTVSYCGTTPLFLGGLVYLTTGCPLTNLVFNSAANIIPNACGDGNFAVHFPSLPAGTYYYPVLEAPGSSGDYTLVFTAAPCAATPPANAECSNAIMLSASDACEFVNGTVEHATTAGVTGTACGNGDVSDGVWYAFVATSPSVEITVEPSAEFNVHLSLIGGDCTGRTLLACAIGQNFGAATTLSATGLVVGDTFHLRVADWYAGIPRTSTFDICVVAVAASECEAAAGNVVPDAANVCYTGPSTAISATPSGTSIIPPGFSMLYLLTSSSGVVLAIDDQPSFNAPYIGDLSIHTLVHDPATFDPQDIRLGQSTIGSLNELFVQGGGAICASLDITGAGFTVENCCGANAGALQAVEDHVCWEEVPVVIAAQADGSAVVPPGFEVAYVLSTTPGGVIVDTASTPSFLVDAPGTYRIHAVVFDPLTISMDTIALDTTTIALLGSYFTIGGGELCGAIDPVGAGIRVALCCPGALGTLAFAEDLLCDTTGGASFTWTLEDADVPAGYTVLFLIATPDGAILDTTSTSSHVLAGPGIRHIHQLIYDSLTLDLSTALGEGATIGGLDTLLVQGGGEVCALLELVGAPVFVVDCRPANDECSNPELVAVQLLETCAGGLIQGDNTYATQGGASAPPCGDEGSTYADVWYVFNTGQNTGITILFDPGTMTSWGISVQDACDGTELLCENRPSAPVDIDTQANTQLLIRIFSDLSMGLPGQFTMCVTGAVTSTICDGAAISTADGETALTICQDATADVVDLTTTSVAPVNYTYVLTDTDSVIVAMVAGSSLDLNALPLGNYLVHGISHDGALAGASIGEPLMGITSTGQCSVFAANAVDVRVEVCSAIQDAEGSAWVIWPNPNTGRFTLAGGEAKGPVTVQVIASDGSLAHALRAVMQPDTPLSVELPASLVPGLYMVRVFSEGAAPAAHRMLVQ